MRISSTWKIATVMFACDTIHDHNVQSDKVIELGESCENPTNSISYSNRCSFFNTYRGNTGPK